MFFNKPASQKFADLIKSLSEVPIEYRVHPEKFAELQESTYNASINSKIN